MTFNGLRAWFEQRLNTNWTTTPIAYDNQDFTAPTNSAWVYASIQPSTSLNASLGPVKVNNTGHFLVEIFTPLNTGSGAAYNLADAMVTLLENQRSGDLFTYAATVRRVGEAVRRLKDIQTEWYQINILVRYEFMS